MSAIVLVVLEAGESAARLRGALAEACGPAVAVEEVASDAPGTPVVLVAEGATDDVCAWIAAGAAVRRRDELLARVAHQLRTPQGALLGWATLLKSRRLDEIARARAVDAIERNARVEARMIEDLLDVSRLLTGGLRLEVGELEICPLVAAAIEASHAAADHAGVTLAAELDEAAGTVSGDARRLEQIVRELLGNALRATARGGRVEVWLAREARRVRLVVHDTGRGIAPDALPHVFDGLRRIDRPANHGLGVGLWRVRHLVQAHGGTVVAESPGEGQGATFTVVLPSGPTG